MELDLLFIYLPRRTFIMIAQKDNQVIQILESNHVKGWYNRGSCMKQGVFIPR